MIRTKQGSSGISLIEVLVVLVLLLSGTNATLFQGAPEGSWRKRIPSIFLDVARFALIAVGVTPSSSAADLKLKCLAAASKARSVPSGGSFLMP